MKGGDGERFSRDGAGTLCPGVEGGGTSGFLGFAVFALGEVAEGVEAE